MDMRRMWEESMAQVAKEQERLEEQIGESEMKRKLTKRALKEAVSKAPLVDDDRDTEEVDRSIGGDDAASARSPTAGLSRRQTALDQIADLSDLESESSDEFFDAVDAGEVEVSKMPLSTPMADDDNTKSELVVSSALDVSKSFRGYENGVRTKLKMDADDRPKISLWVSLGVPSPPSVILCPLTRWPGYSQIHDW